MFEIHIQRTVRCNKATIFIKGNRDRTKVNLKTAFHRVYYFKFCMLLFEPQPLNISDTRIFTLS